MSSIKREPTAEELEKLDRAIAARDRIRATSMYISITECGLTEAQQFIKALTTELQLENPEKFASEKQRREIGFDFTGPMRMRRLSTYVSSVLPVYYYFMYV